MARALVPASLLAVAIACMALSEARADPAQRPSPDPQVGPLHPVTSDDDPHDDFAAFPLVVPHEKHYMRAGLEVGGIVVLGFVDYLLNTAARGGITREGDQTWDLRYDWEDLRGKLIGTAYELDSNKFNTNYISHPLAGTVYFQAARSNHLSFAEAWIFSIIGSSIWEYFGEIREKVSVNDMIVTPSAGAAIGEATMQLAGFFDRGSPTFTNRFFSALFAPVKAINDLFDGAEPERTKHPDAFGFATEPWHRFFLYAGGGATTQSATPGFARATSPDVRFGVDLSVVNLPGYSGAGRHARLFDDGNVSSLAFDAGLSRGDLVHGVFATRVVPVGFYYRDASTDRRGAVNGQGAILGLRIGFEYGVHDFDRDRARPRDLVAIVSPVGIAAEHTLDRGPLRIRTGLDVAGSISGVQPYALSDYLQARPPDGLPTAAANNGYYHAYGVTASPSLAVRYGELEWLSSFRLDTFRAITGLDEAGVDPALAGIDDRRSTLRTSLAWQPGDGGVRLSLDAQRMTRAGDVGSVHASRSESSIAGSVGLVF